MTTEEVAAALHSPQQRVLQMAPRDGRVLTIWLNSEAAHDFTGYGMHCVRERPGHYYAEAYLPGGAGLGVIRTHHGTIKDLDAEAILHAEKIREHAYCGERDERRKA